MKYNSSLFKQSSKSYGKLSLHSDYIKGFLSDNVSLKQQVLLLGEKDKNLKLSYRSYLNLVKRYFSHEYNDYIFNQILVDAVDDIKDGLDNNLSNQEIYNKLKENRKTNWRGQGVEVTFDFFKEYMEFYKEDIKMLERRRRIKKEKIEKIETYNKDLDLSNIKKVDAVVNNRDVNPEKNVNTVVLALDNGVENLIYSYYDGDDDILEPLDTRFKHVVFENLSTKRIENILSKFYTSPDSPDVVTEKRFFYIGPEYYKDDIFDELIASNIFKDFDLFAVSRKINGRMENDVIYFRLFQGEFIQLKKTQKVFENDVRIMLTRGKKNYKNILEKYKEIYKANKW